MSVYEHIYEIFTGFQKKEEKANKKGERESTLKYIKKHFTISINKRATYFDVERAINFWVSTHRTQRETPTTTKRSTKIYK